MEKLNFNPEKFMDMVMDYAPDLLLAIVVLIVGLWIIKGFTKQLKRIMEKRNVDESLRPFLISLISAVLKILLVISVMQMVGVAMTSFVAILAAAGLAIGMALSGTLQNFAGGVMILILKPFKVGDFIESSGHGGVVKEIQIFHTILETPDGRTIILPNAPVSNGALVNKTTKPVRRVDLTFGIGYDDDIDKARKVIQDYVESDSRVLKDPAHQILVSELADSSVNFAVRLWVNTGDYWAVMFDTTENIKKAFDKNKISIPFPQRDVHMVK
ncbi:mechanosensitive ion channel family protein [Saccharicrinis sp. FJH2]|uniref:mechanosensitive ion channel family protein n=1 Tax=Saccharicrinis sp. FJH65 TaxID=3344659 RepID=UPI0035F40927